MTTRTFLKTLCLAPFFLRIPPKTRSGYKTIPLIFTVGGEQFFQAEDGYRCMIVSNYVFEGWGNVGT